MKRRLAVVNTLVLTFFGFVVGVFFSLLLALAITSGEDIPGASHSVINPLGLAGVYVVGGLLGGVLAGIAQALLSSAWGTALVGMLFISPIMAGSSWLYYGSWPAVDWEIVVAGTALVGGPLGFFLRKEFRKFIGDVPDRVTP